jgi:hypothetical protein
MNLLEMSLFERRNKTMHLIEQETKSKKIPLNYKRMRLKRNRVRKNREDLCPDCGAELRVNGRCWFCAYCGWSTCP